MTIAYLRAFYYDPTKLKPKEMLFAALNELQSSVAAIAFKKQEIDKSGDQHPLKKTG